MNPLAFLELAKRLIAKERNPAGLRSSLSRAYYAAFNVAAQFFRAIGHEVPNDGTGHERACEYLNNCRDNQLVVLAERLGSLRQQRNGADYRMGDPNVEKEATVRLWVGVATEIIQKLEDCNGSTARRSNVKSAVQDWRSKVHR
jgi:hypothetical protein